MRKCLGIPSPHSFFPSIFNGLEIRSLAGKPGQRVSTLFLAALLMGVMAGCGAASKNPPPSQAPTISGFAPTSGVPGTAVVITGTNLTGATVVAFNSRAAASFSVDSATQITATVAAGTTTGKILVGTPGGTAASATNFTILNQPTITGFSPASGVVGTAVTITGTNFTGATAVKFNSTAAASFTVDSDTQITATVASGSTTGKITVTTPNGTATSAASFTVIVPAPTISSFNPTSGAVGTAVVITGTNFTGATSVKFNGTSATFTVNNSTQITATVASGSTTGPISVTTAGGTATSATNFTVIIPAPTITGFNPTTGPVGTAVVITGTSFTGTTAVAINGKAVSVFTVNSSTQITATVASGTTSGKITVTTPGGTATSATNFTVTSGGTTLDLSIDGLYLTQATQEYPNPQVPLVQNRSAWVRVFVKANQSNTVAPQVKVDFKQGATTIGTLTIDSPGASVPTSIDSTNAAASWNAAVSSSWIQTGVQVVATVDPSNAIPEADETNNTFTQSEDVRNLKQWAITLVPIQTGDGRLGVVENGTRSRYDWVDFAKRIHPVPDNIDVIIGTTMTTTTILKSDDSDGSWDDVLSDLNAKRSAEGATNRYYYGAVHPNYTSGVAGMGYIPSQPNGQYLAAIGWDLGTTGTGSFPYVLAHEVGHNFGRYHSPCGNPAGPDPNYPYAGAIIGVPGWDIFASSNNLKGASAYLDIMSYCSPLWISDYTYVGVLNFRAASPAGIIVSGTDAGTSPPEGLLIWGRIENGNMTLEPAFRIPVKNPEPQSGPYTWEARDAIGRVLASVSFDAAEVADVPDNRSVRMFSFVVPLNPDVLGAIRTMQVKAGNQELAQRAVSDASAADLESAVQMQELPEHRMQIVWDADRFPVLMLRDARTGEVRGFLRGGNAEIEAAPRELELRAPDATRAEPLRHRRVEP
jgi:hypothetical protein